MRSIVSVMLVPTEIIKASYIITLTVVVCHFLKQIIQNNCYLFKGYFHIRRFKLVAVIKPDGKKQVAMFSRPFTLNASESKYPKGTKFSELRLVYNYILVKVELCFYIGG